MRAGGVGFPMRAVRTAEFLYIRNYQPDRWPAGDPPHFGDIDNGPSKEFVVRHNDSPDYAKFYQLACAKRPAVELYDLKADPAQQVNVASNPKYAKPLDRMSRMLQDHLRQTADPRGTGKQVIWDTSPYYGAPNSQTMK
jgi:hypothetical protein